MEFSPGPQEPEGFGDAGDAAVERFDTSDGGAGLGWVASQLLDLKGRYLDGDLAVWSEAQIEQILLRLFPAKVVVDDEDLGEVVDGVAAFLRFLGREGLLAGGPAAGDRLARFAERLDARFRSAAADPSNWAPGKRLLAAMGADGLDWSDEEAMQRWIRSFNERTIEEREAVLGAVPPAPKPVAPGVAGPLPPVTLPSPEELEAAALGSLGLSRLRRLVEFVGDGRPLTDRGNLKVADGKALIEILGTDDLLGPPVRGELHRVRSSTQLPGVRRTFTVAREAGFVAVEGRRAVPGPEAERLVSEPAEALWAAWWALVRRVGPTRHRRGGDRYGLGWYAEELDAQLPLLLADLSREQAAIGIEDLADEVWEHLEGVFDLDHLEGRTLDLHRGFVESALREALDWFEELGVTRVAGVDEHTDIHGIPHRFGGTVALTSLGAWVMHRFLSHTGDAPVVGGLRDLGALDLLRRVAEVSEVEADAEVDAWIDHRVGGDAADDLVDALVEGDETCRGLAFRALLRIGGPAAGAVERLADHPELGCHATVWRIDSRTGAGADADCSGDPDRFVRLLHAVLELWGPAAIPGWLPAAAGEEGTDAMLDAVWRVRRPETEPVLAAIGGSHPDRATAKAARKALFKHRSSA